MALIVVAGKGGVGKTTVSLGLARMLQVQEADFLFIDADPVGQTQRLLEALPGQTVAEAANSLGDSESLIHEGLIYEGPKYADVQQLIHPLPDGGHVLSMGHATTPGCFCRLNALTGAVIGMAVRRFELVIMDAEAGLEHITRGTGRHATRLLLICDESRAAFDVAADTLKTVRVLGENGHQRLNGTVHLGVFLRESGTRGAVNGVAASLHLPQPRFLPYSREIAVSNLVGLSFPKYNADDPFFEGLFGWVVADGLLETAPPAEEAPEPIGTGADVTLARTA
jgi:CO dehydrogenase maturation factor